MEDLHASLINEEGFIGICWWNPEASWGDWKLKESQRFLSEAHAKIILRVTPSQLTHCHDPDPMTIWNNLMIIHSSHGHSTIIALHHRFHHLHLKHTENMSTYVAFLLEEADVTVTDDDIILAITSGLPWSYDSFLISLNATPDDDYMLAYVIACLVNEYQHQHAHHHQSSTDSTDAALAASTWPLMHHVL